MRVEWWRCCDAGFLGVIIIEVIVTNSVTDPECFDMLVLCVAVCQGRKQMLQRLCTVNF